MFGVKNKRVFQKNSGLSKSSVDEIKKRLLDGRNYLKIDYKLNLELDSRCADHCMTYSLSDKNVCVGDHDQVCERCEALQSVFEDIETALNGNEIQFR